MATDTDRMRALEREAEGLLEDAQVELCNNGASYALTVLRNAERVLRDLQHEEAMAEA